MLELNAENLVPLGLSPAEATTCLALLKAGPSGVSRISQLTVQHRTNIYGALEKRKEKGLASFYVENGVKKYRAADLKQSWSALKEKNKRQKMLFPFSKTSLCKGQKYLMCRCSRG